MRLLVGPCFGLALRLAVVIDSPGVIGWWDREGLALLQWCGRDKGLEVGCGVCSWGGCTGCDMLWLLRWRCSLLLLTNVRGWWQLLLLRGLLLRQLRQQMLLLRLLLRLR